MAKKVVTAQQLENLELAYEGYDPTWIIGAHNDPLPGWSYGPYAAAASANYRMRVNSEIENSHREFFNYHNPYRRTPIPTIAIRGPSGPGQVAITSAGPVPVVTTRAGPPTGPLPGPPSGPVVRASKVVPAPAVTTIVYPHGQGHTLGTGHGYKNIIIMRIPDCCGGCEKKWKDRVTEIPGFRGVNVERGHSKLSMKATVFGDIDTHSVVKTIQKVQPRAEFWGGSVIR